jgi:hypothetical protein
MKIRMIVIVAFIATCLSGYSQNLKVPKTDDLKKSGETVQKTTTAPANMGNLLGELTNNISDNAFTEDFKKQKSGFTDKVNKTTDASGLGGSLAMLGGGLKTGAMDAGWGAVKDKFVKDAKSATTIKTVAGLAGQLESHISPSSFKGTWGQARPVWQSALNTLSK